MSLAILFGFDGACGRPLIFSGHGNPGGSIR